MSIEPILVIHPRDNTISFLDKIKKHLIKSFAGKVHHFNIYPNDESHIECLRRIAKHPENGIIIFLGHGRSDKLYGSKGKLYKSIDFVSSDVIDENPEAYYYNDNFINESNIGVFSQKKVFCLACNSNDKIAEFAFDNGVKSFFGFGDIPTSRGEFEETDSNISNELIMRMRIELIYIIKKSLTLSIANGLNFEGLYDLIRFITNQRITDILINHKKFKERYILADHLYNLKKGAMIFGDSKLPLLE
jgi:hypothetical protein